jgi:hypothetical protein
MARRAIRTDRLIAVLGVAVLVLGAVGAFFVLRDGALVPEPSPSDRALRQIEEKFGPLAEVNLMVSGTSPMIVCGYVGLPIHGEDGRVSRSPVIFISRPKQLFLGDDPRQAEFRDTLRLLCPDLPTPPAVAAVQ